MLYVNDCEYYFAFMYSLSREAKTGLSVNFKLIKNEYKEKCTTRRDQPLVKTTRILTK